MNFNNHLNYININKLQLEKWLAEQELGFSSIRSNKIEFAKIPEMANSFWRYIKKHQKPPTQMEFLRTYMDENSNNEFILSLKLEEVFALEARLKRTYPSLIRDLHFGVALRDLAKTATIICDPKYDLNHDADVLVESNGFLFAANLLTKTRRAVTLRGKKAKSRKQLSNISYMELPLDMKEATSCGPFKLYSVSHFYQFARFISDSVEAKKTELKEFELKEMLKFSPETVDIKK